MFDFCSKYFTEKVRMQRLCLLLLCTYYHLTSIQPSKNIYHNKKNFFSKKNWISVFLSTSFLSFRESIECKELLLEAMRYHLLPEQRSSLSTERTTSRKPDGMKNYVFAIGESCNIEL
jgi:hypothetical protein